MTTTAAEIAALRTFAADPNAAYAAAKTRCTDYRIFAAHTAAEREEHTVDLALVDAYEAASPVYDLPGADPLGDE